MQDINDFVIRRMQRADLAQAAEVHKEAFVRQRLSYEWLECNLNASPRMLCYVAASSVGCAGYIIWTQKSGFRPAVVLELEQIAVMPGLHGQGAGRRLIDESLPDVRKQLSRQGSTLKHIVVTTRADNHAQKLYRSALGAEVDAVVRNLYSADEVIMVARHV